MKCPNEDCPAQMTKVYKALDFIWICCRCGTATWEEGSAIYIPAQAKSYAALREAAEAASKACRAIDGAALVASDEEKFGELVSENLELVQIAIIKLDAALALGAKETT